MEEPKYVYINEDDNKNNKKPIKVSSGGEPKGMNSSDILMYTVFFILLTVFTGGFGILFAVGFVLSKQNKLYRDQGQWHYENEPYGYEYSEAIERDKLKYTDEQKAFLENHPWLFINKKGEYHGKWQYCKKEIYELKHGKYSHWPMRRITELYKEKHPDDPNFLKTATIGYVNSIFEKDRAVSKHIRMIEDIWGEPFNEIAEKRDLVQYFSDYTEIPNEIHVCMNFSYTEYITELQNKEENL